MSTLRETLDELKSELSDIQETVREYADRPTNIDLEPMEEKITELVDAQVTAKLEEAEEKRPQRKGEWVGPEGFKERTLGRIENGRFKGMKESDVLWAGFQLRKMREQFPNFVRTESPEMTKLLDATTAGSGDEWVPTGMAAELWQDFFLANKVVSTLGVIPMPTNPFDIPAWGTATWRKATAGEATAASDPTTFKSTLTATELISEINWNYDLDEDALLAVMPTIRGEIVRSGAEIMDKFVMNADSTATATGNINLDDDTPATDAYYLSAGQDGIRHYYLVDQTGQSTDINSTLDDAEWRAGVARMGKYAASVSDVAAFTNVKTYLISLMGLTNVRTLDKYGPGATILTGELAKMDGIPLIVTEAIALAEDDGKVCKTAASNDEGQIALVSRPMWSVGFRRQLLIEMERDIRKRIFVMVASLRIAVGCRDNGKSSARSDKHTAGIHGIAYA